MAKAPKQDPKQALNKLSTTLNKSPTGKLLAGVGTGWISGMITVRAGRVPVALLGVGIIAFQAAQNQGLIKHTWDDVKNKATEAKEGQKGVLTKVSKFAVENPAFTAGFTGGFLIGLTC